MAVMAESVLHSGSRDRITEDFTPFFKTFIGNKYHYSLFITGINDLKKEIRPASGNWQIANLVDHQERGIA
jgi:hypothetical protein